MSAQPRDDATRAGVDEREEAVDAAHDESAVRTERRWVGRVGRWHGRRAADADAVAGQGREVDEAYGAASCRVASERPSPLMAVDGNQSPLPVPAWNVRPSRRSPARSHAMTLPSRLAV